MSKKIEIAPGTVFGQWTVLSPGRSDKQGVYYNVLCECGTESVVLGRALRRGRSSKCRACSWDENWRTNRRESECIYPTTRGVLGSYLTNVVRNATSGSRNFSVTITMEDLADQWELQKGKCALSGIELTLASSMRQLVHSTASVDRIDSKVGYTRENVQWVHKDINKMKLNHPEPYFFQMCQAVVAHKDQTKKLREGSRPWLQS